VSDREDEYERDLWRFCAETVAERPYFKIWQVRLIKQRLLDAIDDVPDLGVLIRKAEPDMMAFAESRMTLAEAYRW